MWSFFYGKFVCISILNAPIKLKGEINMSFGKYYYDEENIDLWRETDFTNDEYFNEEFILTDYNDVNCAEYHPGDDDNYDDYIDESEEAYQELYGLYDEDLDLDELEEDPVYEIAEDDTEENENIVIKTTQTPIPELNTQQLKDLEQHEENMKTGNYGELLSLEYERDNLKGTPYYDKVDMTKALNRKNGYDILSYERDGTPKYIEVKSSVNDNDNFIISAPELRVAHDMLKQGKQHKVYIIKNIYSDSKRTLEIIDDVFDEFDFEATGYIATRKTNRSPKKIKLTVSCSE
jgi:Domain of unknown function (DUF3883)